MLFVLLADGVPAGTPVAATLTCVLPLARLQRQRQMVQQFYSEVGSLEEVMEEAAYVLGDESYSVLNQVSYSSFSSSSLAVSPLTILTQLLFATSPNHNPISEPPQKLPLAAPTACSTR